MRDPLRIDDLRKPLLSDGQRAARDYVANLDLTLDAEQLMQQARDRARCDDFGDPGFRARLDATIDAVEADTGLEGIGRLAVRQRTLRLLTSRLLVEDLVRRRPEILAIELPAPIIVIADCTTDTGSRCVIANVASGNVASSAGICSRCCGDFNTHVFGPRKYVSTFRTFFV